MKFTSASFVALTLVLTACGAQSADQTQTNEWGQSVSQGKKEAAKIRAMTDADEYQKGLELDAAIKDPAQASETGITIKLSNNAAVNNLVQSIGKRVALTSSRNNIRYTFQVVESDDVNAFATLGGFVYVNTGLLKMAENEAQVASVIAHEVGHIAKRHVVEALAQQAEVQGWQNGTGRLGGTLLGAFSAVIFQLPKSRSAEFQADNVGYLNVRASGYVADEMVEFYEDVLLQMSSGGSTILSTHPDTRQRIQRLRSLRVNSDASGYGNDDAGYRSVISSL
jgi:predicted Zn-dependent protease